MSLSPSTKMPRVWDVPGRGTAAGRALFRLYNGFAAARNKGEDYSLQNRLNILRRLSTAGTPPPAPSEVSCSSSIPNRKPKVTVRVPRFRRKTRAEDEHADYPVGGKRKASLILEKAREEFENMTLPPPPTKPVLDDKEKKRLQTIFEWHGLLDEGEMLQPPPKPKLAPVAPVKGSKEEKEQLLDLISKEIQDREDFLQDMQQLGKDEPYRMQIQSEILDRVKQMKKLDKLLEAQLSKSVNDVVTKRDGHSPRKSVSWDTNDVQIS